MRQIHSAAARLQVVGHEALADAVLQTGPRCAAILCVDVVIEHRGRYVLSKKNRPEQNRCGSPAAGPQGEHLRRRERKVKEEVGSASRSSGRIDTSKYLFADDYGLRNGVHGVSIVF